MKPTILTLALTFCLSLAAQASTYTVTNTNDSGAGSLRSALSSAANGDKINFVVTGTITLTSGELVIAANVTINGPGVAKLAISGNNQFTVFQVDSGVTAASISYVTIEDGYDDSAAGGGGINNQGALTLNHVVLSDNTENAVASTGGGISNKGTLTVNNCTLSGNSGEGDGDIGGAIYNAGTLTVHHSVLSGNFAWVFGGGIYNSGTLTVSYSTLGNGTGSPGGSGSDIYNTSTGTLILSHSTLSGGTCCGGEGGEIYNGGAATISHSTLSNSENYQGSGGAIYNSGTMTVSDSTLSGNSAPEDLGGAIFNDSAGTLTLTNSTLSGNSAPAGDGGAIYNGGKLTMTNSTLWGNSVPEGGDGGAIYNDGTLAVSFSTLSGNSLPDGGRGGAIYSGAGTLVLKGTLLADQTSGENCYIGGSGTLTSDGYNLSDDSTCSSLTQTGDQNDSATAALSPSGLQHNGGPTQTIALLSTSSAVDAIPPSACKDALGNPVPTDQRGVARPQGSGCDIGAYEFVPFVSPNKLNFGEVKLGQTKTEVVTLTNTGETELTIGKISFINVSGNSSEFSFHRNCGPGLMPGDSCTVAVKFSACEGAKDTVKLNIVTSAPGSALQVPIKATGIP
jgi:Abnormal spindle-like microcephaly-assoc'd, ASPM-SPD-2-Hydin